MHLFPSNSPPLQGTHELLAPFKPLLKFALVKAVIFLSYWQGLFISIATGAGAIPTSERVVLSWSCRFCCWYSCWLSDQPVHLQHLLSTIKDSDNLKSWRLPMFPCCRLILLPCFLLLVQPRTA